MIDSPDVPVINLTGSSKTGQAIMAACAKNMKRFGGELGGKTPVLLFDDADLDKALPKVEKGAHRLRRTVLHDRQPAPRPPSNLGHCP
jgi:acyl-CoA reductase-like NAD-dependent aldehyde dehydrogenase